MGVSLTVRDKFLLRLGYPDVSDLLIADLLESAEAYILDRIGRDVLPERLKGVQLELALIAYNRLGAEGESSRGEGGISRSFEALPPTIEKQLQSYPRKAGVIHV